MPADWSYNARTVPGFPEWYYRIGLGGPCWAVTHLHDGYTHSQIDPNGIVSTRNAPAELVRWLLDNHPPLDSWVRPTEDQVKASRVSECDLRLAAG